MKRYIKPISLLLALLLCATFAGCGLFRDNPLQPIEKPAYEFDYEGDLTPGGDASVRALYTDVVSMGKGIPAFDYSEQEAADLMRQIDDLYECLEGDDPAAFVAMFTYVQCGAYARMESQCSLAQLEYSLYREDGEAAENFEWMRAFAADVSTRLSRLYRLVYDSPAKEVFFRGWTQEDIRMALLYADAADDELAALQREYDELLVEYYELQQSESFIEESAELYEKAVRINNDIAQKLGYENYMDYAYEFVFLRGYAPEDIAAVRAYVKEHLVPLYQRVDAELTLMESDMRQSEIDAINALMYQEYNSPDVQAYMKMVGKGFSDTYTDMMDKQNFCFAYNAEVSRDGAFTDWLAAQGHPYVYMGANYADAFTFVHEFGHYYAFSVDANRAVSNDLVELQSQGNEWLYLAYLSEQNNDIASMYTVLYRLYNDIGSVILCLAVDEFEQSVYENPALCENPASLDALFTEILSGYIDPGAFGGGISEYWHYVTFDAAGYYVSYAVALIPCFELYFMAETDLESAVQTYLLLSEYKGTQTYFEVLDLAGLQNPMGKDYVPVDYDVLYELMQKKQN